MSKGAPDLDDLPPPPAGRSGWPWTEGGPSVSLLDEPPRITVVTPSFNQAQWLEQTIRSVLLQGWPALDYVVMDGGSSDHSAEIIERYRPWLRHAQSEPDEGQSAAINAGFRHGDGELLAWVNSDDYLLPGALDALVGLRRQQPDAVLWAGAGNGVDRDEHHLGTHPSTSAEAEAYGLWDLPGGAAIFQPSTLIDARRYREVGGLDESLHYVMDVDLWIKLARKGRIACTEQAISCARQYPQAKTYADPSTHTLEFIRVLEAHGMHDAARERLRFYAVLHMERSDDDRPLWAVAYRRLLRHAIARTSNGLRRRLGLADRNPLKRPEDDAP